MKNNVKEIITEAVLGFLNEAKEVKPPGGKKVLPVNFPETPEKFELPVKSGKPPKIHPSFNKPSTQFTQPGVNEEDLSEEQKVEVKEIVTKTLARPGFLGISYATNLEENTTTMGARIDPTANGDWVLAKEEVLYTLPMKYGKKLHEYVKELRK